VTIGIVECVFFYKYSKSAFRALYGRLGGTGGYTKDFLQIRKPVQQTLDDVFQRNDEQSINIEYRWPTGASPGRWVDAGMRGQLKWNTQQKPLPWVVGNSATSIEIGLAGVSTLTDPDAADAEYQRIIATGCEPYLIGVKLRGEARVLHVRMYFGNPPVGREDRGIDVLPLELRNKIAAEVEDCGIVHFTNVFLQGGIETTARSPELVARILDTLKREPNVLLVGPPGTGKTVALEDLRDYYGVGSQVRSFTFDTDVWGPAWGTTSESRSVSLVFHPAYSYETFVAGLMPEATENGMSLRAEPGPLLSLAHWTAESERKSLLILDEFNRGPAAAIFGDTLSLLDKEKRIGKGQNGASIQRPYASYSMAVQPTFARQDGICDVGDSLTLPSELAIVAAMNSTDRSVAPLDAALRRRFAVIRVGPDYQVLSNHLGVQYEAAIAAPLPEQNDITTWPVEAIAALSVKILFQMNQRIEFCLGEDFELGHALMWNIRAPDPETFLRNLSAAVATKIIPTLQTTFLDQDEALAAVLGVPASLSVQVGQPAPVGVAAYWRTAPTALAAINPRRLTVTRLHDMNLEHQIGALRTLQNV
jgi:5-methylcytosine-specific restriction protein B